MDNLHDEFIKTKKVKFMAENHDTRVNPSGKKAVTILMFLLPGLVAIIMLLLQIEIAITTKELHLELFITIAVVVMIALLILSTMFEKTTKRISTIILEPTCLRVQLLKDKKRNFAREISYKLKDIQLQYVLDKYQKDGKGKTAKAYHKVTIKEAKQKTHYNILIAQDKEDEFENFIVYTNLMSNKEKD